MLEVVVSSVCVLGHTDNNNNNPEYLGGETMTAEIKDQPALAHLAKGHSCWLWVVDQCPYCGRRHIHGGGPLDGDPRAVIGARVAHCRNNRGREYLLSEQEVTE